MPVSGPGTYGAAEVAVKPASPEGRLIRFDVKVEENLDIDPDQAIAALDETTLERVNEIARGISVEASVACVGPHEVSEFA